MQPVVESRPPQLTTRESEELNVWSAKVGWETDYRQVGRGKFHAWFKMSLSRELKVVDQSFDQELTVSGVPPDGYVPLLVPMNRGDLGVFQGKTVQENDAFLVCPGSQATLRTPANLRMFSLHLPETRIRSALHAMHQEPDAFLGESRVIKLNCKVRQRLALIRSQVLDADGPDTFHGPATVYQMELEELFAITLAEGLAGSEEAGPGVLARRNRVEYVNLARDYIESHLTTPLGIETLSRATGVSPRTLHYSFREVYQLTPLQYIKVRRLHAARLRLLEPQTPDMTVTRVAFDYGFSHLSYFAKDYRSLFGESPSETLKGGLARSCVSPRNGRVL